MTVLVVAYLSTGNRDPYSQQRAVEIGMPLLVVVATVGYSALRERPRRPVPQAAGRRMVPAAAIWAVTVLLLVPLGIVAFVNVRTATATDFIPRSRPRLPDGRSGLRPGRGLGAGARPG